MTILEIKTELVNLFKKNNLLDEQGNFISGISPHVVAQNAAVYLFHKYFNNSPVKEKSDEEKCIGTPEIKFPREAALAPYGVIDNCEREVGVKLDPNAIVPVYANEFASGADIVANFTNVPVYAAYAEKFKKQPFVDFQVVEDGEGYYIIIMPGKCAPIPTGNYVELPIHTELQIRPRSGLAGKQGLTVINTPGTIDCDYRGEITVLLHNSTTNPRIIKSGMKIAQAVLCPVLRANWVTKEELGETERGAGGFNSTGTFIGGSIINTDYAAH